MSLTREQWIEMWESVKKIERLSDYFALSHRREKEHEIKKETKFIKEQIQSVIGQME